MKTMVDQYHKLGIGVCWLLQSTSSPMLVPRGLVGWPLCSVVQCAAGSLYNSSSSAADSGASKTVRLAKGKGNHGDHYDFDKDLICDHHNHQEEKLV